MRGRNTDRIEHLKREASLTPNPDALAPPRRPMFGVDRHIHAFALPPFGRTKATVPLLFRLLLQPNTRIVKPLDATIVIVARDHVVERDLAAVAVGGFGRVERHLGGVRADGGGGGGGREGATTAFLG